tara:strand:- start:737 stop:1672 length:936 start_codon:yes stop_codon:yes gene_type:complete
MKSFSDLTFQLDETMLGQSMVAKKPRRSQLLRSIATNIKDRLMGGQKKRGDIDQKQVVKIRSGAMLSSLNPTRKQRLDQATKTLRGLRDSGKFGNPALEGKPQRKIANARLKALASGLGKRKDEINKAAEAIAARRGISVADARKRVVRQAVSRAVNRMETKAARKRLNENLQQLDEVLPAVLAGAAGMKLLGGLSQTAPLVAAIGVHGATTSLGSAIGGGLSAIGDIGGAFMKNRMAQAMQKRAQRTQKRQALLSKQQSADMAMGVSPTTGVPSNIKINTNPRATVAQLRGTGGTQLGGSSVGKQFAAKY